LALLALKLTPPAALNSFRPSRVRASSDHLCCFFPSPFFNSLITSFFNPSYDFLGPFVIRTTLVPIHSRPLSGRGIPSPLKATVLSYGSVIVSASPPRPGSGFQIFMSPCPLSDPLQLERRILFPLNFRHCIFFPRPPPTLWAWCDLFPVKPQHLFFPF